MRFHDKSVLLTAAAIFYGAAAMLMCARPTAAESPFINTWQALYPNSSTSTNVQAGTGQVCQMCHFSSAGGNGWNAYGWKIRQGLHAGQNLLTAITNAETGDSDLDPTGTINLDEINANTQPGWTPGPNNTRYSTGGTQTGMSPPAGILGNLDPPSSTPFCFGDGSATACPCGNSSLVGNNEGCLSSLGTGGKLVASGTPSLAADTVVLAGTQMPNSSALYFQGTTQVGGGLGAVFGDGLRCAGGTVVRLGTKANAVGASQFPAVGDPSVSVKGLVAAPGVRTYQCWYRNAATFCTVSTFNLTNGVQLTWSP
jgi:hypothetical protein